MQTDHGVYNRGHRKRLLEKFTTAGIEALHDYEALELLLTFVIRRQDVKRQAKALLEKFGSVKGIMDAESNDLQTVPGIGDRSAILFKLIKEIASLYLKQKAMGKKQVSCTTELLDFCRTKMGGRRMRNFA